MLRFWDADEIFVIGRSSLPTDVQFKSRPLVFSRAPNYTAPEEVYRTERDMGKNKDFNVTSNLKWGFPVDSGFTYMLRLHFFELNPDINDPYNRKNIYIADQLAEERANVLNWGNRKGVPVYGDYAVIISGDAKSASLSLKMHPAKEEMNEYIDAFLNGLEIFKISDSQNNLAGPNPDPLPPSPANLNHLPVKTQRKTKSTVTVGVVIGVVASIIILISSAVALFVVRQRKKVKQSSKSSGGTFKGSFLPSELCRHFSIAEIRAATSNFDEHFNIGVGGFGNVYKGYIDGGHTPVAIKRLKQGSQQGHHEFRTEIEMRGLHYLHTGAIRNIIHRDVKTTNIFLDEKWIAKFSDFGLSKIGPTGVSKTHISTVVKGSIGYLDPEYYKRQRLTLKSDVYSFGVVLLEVLCGRPPFLPTVEKEKASLVEWVRKCHHEGVIHQTVDTFLIESITPESLKAFSDMALKCLEDDPNERPSMSDVEWGLEFALQLQENSQETEGKSEEERALLSEGTSMEESKVGRTNGEMSFALWNDVCKV